MAAKDALIESFLQEYPGAEDAGRGHPALQGCEDVRWTDYIGCPAAAPVLLRALLDRTAGPEAERVLSGVLFNDITSMNAAMPAALPFLIRLAGDPYVPVRSDLLDLLVSAAEFSESVAGQNEAWVMWFGSDEERPARARCRAVFAEHARVVGALAAEVGDPDRRASLRRAARLG
ncbi:hypothetical protein [Streptomyces sp. NPDC058955]|uniref:hypothetical protein n=1 Tax=unclassified Streptomyces TaxID=2593676 RepID=UPI0036482A57